MHITYYKSDEIAVIQKEEQAKDLHETIKIWMRLLLATCYV